MSKHGGSRPGAGRPRMYRQQRSKLSVMVDTRLLRKLDKWRGKHGKTRSWCVGEAIERLLR